MSEAPIKPRRSKWRTITVEVDAEVSVRECLEYLDDEDLIEEMEQRDLARKKLDVSDERDEMLRDAIDLLQKGEMAETILMLERALFPKFKSVELCEREFNKLKDCTVTPTDGAK
jgi:hypothetical protein